MRVTSYELQLRVTSCELQIDKINRGYYTAARGNEFYFRVVNGKYATQVPDVVSYEFYEWCVFQ